MQVVAVNAGLGIHCFKPESTIESCIAEAEQTIKSGLAAENYNRLKQIKSTIKLSLS
jgi:anthranilate phosphoribosyltransferase